MLEGTRIRCAQGPFALRALFGSFRGYAGDISPAGALDAVATDGNTYLIDLRSAREKVTSCRV